MIKIFNYANNSIFNQSNKRKILWTFNHSISTN
nr:MAG TPA: hypothetical protein [Caudoviricetes sp.]